MTADDAARLTSSADFSTISVGDQIRFPRERFWWTVRDRDERYIVATRQQPFEPQGRLLYTVVDLTGWQDRQRNGAGFGVVRSSLDTLGGGWDLGPDGEGAEQIIPALRSGEWELSVRRVIDAQSFQRRGPDQGQRRNLHMGTNDRPTHQGATRPTHRNGEMDMDRQRQMDLMAERRRERNRRPVAEPDGATLALAGPAESFNEPVDDTATHVLSAIGEHTVRCSCGQVDPAPTEVVEQVARGQW